MTATDTASSPAPSAPMRDPAGRGGLVDVFRRRYLLKLLVRKEVKVRYQGSLLGMGWSYIQPMMRFVVYYVIIGVVLAMNRSVPNFAVHIVSGMTLVHFFSETFGSTTRSVVKNKSLVRKVGLPREMFPVASTLVSAVNIIPGLVILIVAAVLTGWHPTADLVPSALLGFTLVGVWGFGLGLLFSAFNVYYRDFSKVVQVITMLLPWSTPMIYEYARVAKVFEDRAWWALEIYLANPVAEAVMLFQQAFWIPTVDDQGLSKPGEHDALDLAPHLYERGLILLVIGLLLIWFAQKMFSRLESSFAEQL
jgi:ABC-2 type transport system permease protein